MKDFDKEFFQRSWGEGGYYENFSYGIGIDKVCEVALYPFLNKEKTVLEIGCGGGVFTERIVGKVKYLYGIDVIKQPERFKEFADFTYIELTDKNYSCTGIKSNSIDFCFAYNVFCHLSNEAITKYLKSVNRVLKSGGDFVFMLASYAHTRQHLDREYELGELTPLGHFHQSLETLPVIIGHGWTVISVNLTPEHRDIIVHLKKL